MTTTMIIIIIIIFHVYLIFHCDRQLVKLFPQLHTEVEKPLLTFRGDNFKKDLKKYDHHIADLRKQLASRYGGVEKVNSLAAPR